LCFANYSYAHTHTHTHTHTMRHIVVIPVELYTLERGLNIFKRLYVSIATTGRGQRTAILFSRAGLTWTTQHTHTHTHTSILSQTASPARNSR